MTRPSNPSLRHAALRRHAAICATASLIYIASYGVTAYMVAPLQKALFPSLVMSLLFLPHGARVLTAWLYGWRSFVYLLPGALICNLHFAGANAFSGTVLLGTTASLVAAPLAFSLLRRAMPDIPLDIGNTRITTVIAVGFMASVFNLTALKLAYGLGPVEGLVIFLGDASGLIASTLMVWGALAFRQRA